MFAKQLQDIAQDISTKYRHKLQIHNSHGLHRVVNAIIRKGKRMKQCLQLF